MALVVTGAPGRAQEAQQLFPAPPSEPPTLATSVVGVQVTEPPTLYHRGQVSSPPEQSKLVLVPRDRDVVLSSGGRRALSYGYGEGDETWVEILPERRTVLRGTLRFLPDAVGHATIAFEMKGGEDETRAVFALLGEKPVPLWSARDLRWVSVSDDGRFAAVGDGSAVKVAATAGEPVLGVLEARSDSGALSPDGEWLVLESSNGAAAQLSWVIVGAPAPQPVETFEVGLGGRLYFRAVNPMAVHVAPRAVTYFRIDDSGPRLLGRREPPPGFSWRSAAFDGQGRLALGRIRVVQRPFRVPSDVADPFKAGEASLGIDFFADVPGEPASSVEWSIPLWNHVAPALDFALDGSCLANAGHSVHQVEPPWSR